MKFDNASNKKLSDIKIIKNQDTHPNYILVGVLLVLSLYEYSVVNKKKKPFEEDVIVDKLNFQID